jgi:hypothetical protein
MRSLFEEWRIQAILISHITTNSFEQMIQEIINKDIANGTINVDYDLRDMPKAIREPAIACSQFYTSYTNYLISRFTAIIELFLKDTVKEQLKLNQNLTEKLLSSNIKIMPLKKYLKHFDTDEYMTMLNIGAGEYTKGEKWSKKFKNCCAFLEIDSQCQNQDINKKLDSLFDIRNDILHLNRHQTEDKIPKIKTTNGLEYDRETPLDNNQYMEIIEYLIQLRYDTIIMLQNFTTELYKKWSPQYDSAETRICQINDYLRTLKLKSMPV